MNACPVFDCMQFYKRADADDAVKDMDGKDFMGTWVIN
jgi:hypothetical protein